MATLNPSLRVWFGNRWTSGFVRQPTVDNSSTDLGILFLASTEQGEQMTPEDQDPMFGDEAFPDEQPPSLPAHPAAAAFPPMQVNEFNALKADIEANGQRHLITLDPEGRVLDGLNRLRACTVMEIEPQFETYSGDDPLGVVIGRNVIRRHLSVSQKAAIAVGLEDLYADDAAERQQAGKALSDDPGATSPKGRALGFACDDMGVSRRTAQDAKIIRNHDPALFHEVWLGNITVNAALNRIKPTEPTADTRAARLRKFSVAMRGVTDALDSFDPSELARDVSTDPDPRRTDVARGWAEDCLKWLERFVADVRTE